MTDNTRIATYTRVSTLRQEEEQTSQTQLAAIVDEAQKKGLNIVRQYADEGWSGDMLARPALDRLRADAKLKLFEAVLIYDPDRLARRYSFQELIMDELKDAGVEVLYVTVNAPKNSEDKILYGVRGIFAEYERMKITERFRMGKIRKVKEGNIIVSTPMYGYDYIQRNRDTNTNGYYVVNEHEARVVRMIFAWVAEEGCTTRGAAQRLKELGIPPKRSKRGVWHPSSVGALLKNKGYTGEWAFGRTYFVVPENPIKTEKYRRVRKSSGRKRPEESWIKAKIPAIIDNELFEKAQKQLRENFVLSKRKTKSEYLLRGKIKCSCGKPMSGDMGNGKYKYYRCPDRIYNFPAPRNCFSRALNGKNTENAVWDMVTSLMTSPETIWEHLQLWSKEIKAQSMAKADLLAIENELKKIGIQEARFTQAYAAGTFSLSRLQHYLEPVHKKKEALEGELTIIKDRQVPEMSLPDKTEISAFCERAALKLTELSFAQKREILLDVVDKIRYEGDTLKVSGHLKMPKDISGMCPDGYYNEDTITKNISINNYNIPFQFEIQIKRDSRNRAK